MSGYSVRPNSAPEASASFLAVVDRLETCDRWDGGRPMLDQQGLVFGWYHDSIPSDPEKAVLESRVKLPPGPPPSTVRPYGRR